MPIQKFELIISNEQRVVLASALRIDISEYTQDNTEREDLLSMLETLHENVVNDLTS